ncbi:MAG: hypothetical protein JRH15_21915 [Deltaproteobacteria bacterium]|nr:hypothetical protein [Deltaproteobacteria bacterium]
METTVYNPQKGRLETIDVVVTDDNTTWFENYTDNSDKGGLLIKDFDFTYPIRIYGLSRAEINYDQEQAKKIKHFYDVEA